MITAAVWDFPTMLFDQVAEGGLVLMPVELRGGGCQVSVFRRDGEAFVAERAVPGWFVPLVGAGQQRPRLRSALSELPFWNEIDHATPLRLPLPLATGPEGGGGSAVAAFRAFLGRTEPGFTVFGDGEPAEQRPWLPAEPFGIVDAAGRSVAVWSGGELTGYGGPGAMRSLARAYKRWASLGLPGLAGLGLQRGSGRGCSGWVQFDVGRDTHRDRAGLAAIAGRRGLEVAPGRDAPRSQATRAA